MNFLQAIHANMAYIIPYHVRKKTSGIADFDLNPNVWKYCIQRSCEPL